MPRGRPSTKNRPQWALAIAARRASLGLTQEELADRSGVLSQKVVSDFENARTDLRETSVPRAAALARALGWSLYELQDATGVDLGLGRNPNSALTVAAVHGVEVFPLAAADNALLPAYGHSVMLAPRSDGQPHPPHLRAFVMNSDEMTVLGQRSLHEGDYVVTDLHDQSLNHNDLYVIVRNGQVHVRRFKATEMGRGFYADNVTHDPIPTSGTRIVGRVYRLWSDRAPSPMN